ncbi:hypothetical protein BDY21DRAFT_344001 [Lineolata rhizophorae]|uniref:Uncharacterized protein n=1 Tax=Lineolata rhizophorae TaxID=578093 RepID=A0A6A6P0D8_9PEZI|nr:hypothetical protein BDY21DRAFT_344001 [Lineolata rhizophorae]
MPWFRKPCRRESTRIHALPPRGAIQPRLSRRRMTSSPEPSSIVTTEKSRVGQARPRPPA